MATSDTLCLIRRESVLFPGKDVACVGRKGLETVNAFSLKHNDLNLENPIPIYEYNENRKTYVHNNCRKKHANARRYEQMRKRKHDADPDSTPKRQPGYGQKFSVHTDCYLCGKCVDKNKAKRFPNNTGSLGMNLVRL